MNNINVKNLVIGKNTFISPKATIRGLNGPATNIVIGDNSYIGDDVQIIIDDLEIGDYCKIHHHTNIHGYQKCKIGHNAWIGQYVIIDSIGSTTIGNNCCIGSSSHLWSHIKFGDTLEGCRFSSNKPLIIKDDVWIAGNCTITPITANEKSMVLANSVVTKDLLSNHVYAGNPAVDISKKVGMQFDNVPIGKKMENMINLLSEFSTETSLLKIVEDESDFNLEDQVSYPLQKDSLSEFLRHSLLQN